MSIFSAIAPIAGAAIGGLFGKDAAEEQAEATREAAELSGIPKLWAPMEPYAEEIRDYATNLFEQGLFSPGPHPGELLGRSNLLHYAEGQLPENIAAYQSSVLQGLDPSLNPYVQDMLGVVRSEAMKDYEGALSKISDQFQGGGTGASRRTLAEMRAAEMATEQMANARARILSQAHRDALAQQRGAWAASPQMLAAGFMPAQTQLDVGKMYGQDWLREAQNLAGYQAALAPQMQFGSGTQYPVVPSPTGGLLQGAGAGFGIGQTLAGIWKQPQPQQSYAQTAVGPEVTSAAPASFWDFS